MLKDVRHVQWTGRQAVIALPEHIDVSNAGPICEELLWAISRGAEALIADLATTISCDDAGADALARAYQQAVISGTELRLVVTAQVVRGMLSRNGLDRLVPIYPSLEAATATGTFTLTVIRDVTKACRLADLADLARAAVAAQQAHCGQDVLDSVTTSLYNAGLSLQAAAGLPHDVASNSIAAALRHLDDTIREIRDNAFATCDQRTRPAPRNGAA